MTTIRTAALCLAAALAAVPPSAPAAEGRGITGPELVDILQEEGYRAKLDTDGEGDPMVSSRMGGLDIFVYFYDCTPAKRCGSLQFSVGLDLADGTTHEVINEFNTSFRYVRAFLDHEMDPFMQYDFEVLHTDHVPFITSQMAMWEDLLDEFTRATGFDESRTPDDGPEDVPAADRSRAP